jgi:hypothetical protein
MIKFDVRLNVKLPLVSRSAITARERMHGRACLLACIFMIVLIAGCSTQAAKSVPSTDANEPLSIEDVWGIEIVGVRLAAAGYMIGFTYKVLDSDKARPLLNHKVQPILTDKESGAKVTVLSHYKVGTLRTTDRAGKPPVPGNNYFVYFANPGKFIKAGSNVSVEIGDFKAENLIVE